MRIALMNNKGGAGKTFTTLSLAEAFAGKGKRVLVVDMDPQANATRRLGVELGDGVPTLTDVLRVGVRNGDAAGAVRPCGWPAPYGWAKPTDTAGNMPGNIDVLPADLALEDRTLEAGQLGAANRLRKALYGTDDPYDVTLIDCAPSIGHLAQMTIAALDDEHDTVLCPLVPENDAMTGAQRAVAYVDLAGVEIGVRARVSGLIVTAYRGTALHEARIGQLPTTFPGLPVLGKVPLRARVAELLDSGKPLSTDTHTSSSAVAVRATFDAIADHLLTRQEMPA